MFSNLEHVIGLICFFTIPGTMSQSYGNMSYSVNPMVEYIQRIPRLNSKLFESSSKDFNLERNEFDNMDNEYTSSVIVFPILLACILLLLLILRLWYWHKMKPKLEVGSDASQEYELSALRKNSQVFYCLYLALYILSCQCLIFVVLNLQKGTETSADAVENIMSVVKDLAFGGLTLSASENQTFSFLNQSLLSCPEASVTMSFQDDYVTTLNSYFDLLDPLPQIVARLDGFLYMWGTAMGYVAFSLYLFFMAFVFPLAVTLLQNKWNKMELIVSFGFFSVAALLAISCLLLIALVSSN